MRIGKQIRLRSGDCVVQLSKVAAGVLFLLYAGIWIATLLLGNVNVKQLCLTSIPWYAFFAGLLLGALLEESQGKRFALASSFLLPFGFSLVYAIVQFSLAAKRGEFASLQAYPASAACLAAVLTGVAILRGNRVGTRLCACLTACAYAAAMTLIWLHASFSVSLLLQTGLVAMVAAGCITVACAVKAEPAPKRKASKPTPTLVDCKRDLAQHTLLLFLTFGVWRLIWTYRMTRCFEIGKRHGTKAGRTIVLYLLVPFYAVYWNHRCAQTLDVRRQERGLIGKSTLPCLLLTLFGCGGIATILMQDTVNALADRTLYLNTRLLSRDATPLQYADAPILIAERCVRKERASRSVFGTVRILPVTREPIIAIRLDVFGKDVTGETIETQRDLCIANLPNEERASAGFTSEIPFSAAAVRTFSIVPTRVQFTNGVEWRASDPTCRLLKPQRRLDADGKTAAEIWLFRQRVAAQAPNCSAEYVPMDWGEWIGCCCGGAGKRDGICPRCGAPLQTIFELYTADDTEQANAEEQRRMRAKTSARNGYGYAMIYVVLLAALVLPFSYLVPEWMLYRAMQTYRAGEFEAAKEQFALLDAYMGDNEYAKLCDYGIAEELEEQGNVEAAAQKFAELGGFRDSALRSAALSESIAYDYATACYQRGDFQGAITALEPLDRTAYSDADYLYQNAHLGAISACLQDNRLLDAMALAKTYAAKLYWEPDGDRMKMYEQQLRTYLEEQADNSEKIVLWTYFDMTEQVGQHSKELLASAEVFRDGELYGLTIKDGRVHPCTLLAAKYRSITLVKGADFVFASVQGVLMSTMLADGTFKTEPLFSTYSRLDDSYYRIANAGKIGLLDNDGEVALPMTYDELALFRSYNTKQLVWVREDTLWGVYDLKTKAITVAPQYHAAPTLFQYDENGQLSETGDYAYLDGMLVNDEGTAIPVPDDVKIGR